MLTLVKRASHSCIFSRRLLILPLPLWVLKRDVYHIKSVKFTCFQFFYIEAEVAPGMYVIVIGTNGIIASVLLRCSSLESPFFFFCFFVFFAARHPCGNMRLATSRIQWQFNGSFCRRPQHIHSSDGINDQGNEFKSFCANPGFGNPFFSWFFNMNQRKRFRAIPWADTTTSPFINDLLTY